MHSTEPRPTALGICEDFEAAFKAFKALQARQDAQMAEGLGELIKKTVSEGIRQEMRPGGLLHRKADDLPAMAPEKAAAIRAQILGMATMAPYEPLPLPPRTTPLLSECIDSLTAYVQALEQQLRRLSASPASRHEQSAHEACAPGGAAAEALPLRLSCRMRLALRRATARRG